MAVPWPGFFISVEGLDGAGKSTQVAALAAAIRNDGEEVVCVREPGDTVVGDIIRDLLLHKLEVPLDAWSEALLFNAGRSQLLRERVLPALERGDVVIADRFADSTLAYQGGGRGLDRSMLESLHRHACGDVWPDLTILLDIPLSTAASRKRADELPIDRFEGAAQDFHRRVKDTFDELAAANPHRFVRIDGTLAPGTVSDQVIATARGRLAQRRARPLAPAASSRRSRNESA